MKRTAVLSVLVILVVFAALSGCTSSPQTPPPATPAVMATTPVVATTAPAPVATPDPYPGALSLNTPVAFGTGTKTGELTATSYVVKPTFSWVDPSWNSPREQLDSSKPLETQKGYNTKKPAEGNTFVFVYLSAVGTGTEAVYAPAPSQIVLISDGKTIPYTTVGGAKTVVDGITGSEYDYLIGTGGTGGYVQPGRSNTAKGYLIYEVPASFVPEKTYVLAQADAKTQGIWKLA